MINRLLAEDSASPYWHWERNCLVIALPHLYKLGDTYTARDLYDFYQSRRVVCVKKARTPSQMVRASARSTREAALAVLPELCQKLGLPRPQNQNEVAMVLRSGKAWIAACTLAAAQVPWMPEQMPASGGNSVFWRLSRLNLMMVNMAVLPAELLAECRRKWSPWVYRQPDCAVQVLYRCPCQVEAARCGSAELFLNNSVCLSLSFQCYNLRGVSGD